MACNSNTARQDGLFGSVHALQSGAYDARLQSRQQKLTQLKRQHTNQLEQLKALKNKTVLKAGQIQKLREDVDLGQARKARHAANIKALNARRHALQRQLMILEQAVKTMDQQSLEKAAHSHEQASSINQLTKERDQLRRQLQILIEKGI